MRQGQFATGSMYAFPHSSSKLLGSEIQFDHSHVQQPIQWILGSATGCIYFNLLSFSEVTTDYFISYFAHNFLDQSTNHSIFKMTEKYEK